MHKLKHFFWPEGDIDDYFETACAGLLIFFQPLPLFAVFLLRRAFCSKHLGLSICGGIADLMGGNIGVDSRPKQGSSFWCKIPFPLSAPVVAPAQAEKALASLAFS